jgi:hypothetical protein
MRALDRITFRICEGLGYALCELAFRTGCRGPFALAYRAGCWFYGKVDEPGIRSGELVPNPNYRPGVDASEPMYLHRKDLA